MSPTESMRSQIAGGRVAQPRIGAAKAERRDADKLFESRAPVILLGGARAVVPD